MRRFFARSRPTFLVNAWCRLVGSHTLRARSFTEKAKSVLPADKFTRRPLTSEPSCFLWIQQLMVWCSPRSSRLQRQLCLIEQNCDVTWIRFALSTTRSHSDACSDCARLLHTTRAPNQEVPCTPIEELRPSASSISRFQFCQDLKVVSTDQRVDLQSIVIPDARTTSSVSLRFRYLCNLVLPVSPGSPNAGTPSWSKTGRRKINHVLGFPCWPSVWHCVSPYHGDCFFGDLAGP